MSFLNDLRLTEKIPLFSRVRTIQNTKDSISPAYIILEFSCIPIGTLNKAKKSASQFYEGQSWGLWADARLREHILQEFNRADCRLQAFLYVCCQSACLTVILRVFVWERQKRIDNIDVNKMQELAKIKTKWTNTLRHFHFREDICKIPTSTTSGKINFTGIFLRNSDAK